MSGKINQTSSKRWIPWAIVILLVGVTAGLHYYFTTQTMIDKSVWWNNLMVQIVVPSTEIMQYSIIESINQFGGSETESDEFWLSAGMSVLGLLIVLILAPWMLVKGYQSMERNDNPDKLIPVWYAGAAVIVVAISSYAYLLSALMPQHDENKTIIEAQRTSNELQSIMMDLAFDASEFMILSSKKDYGNAGVVSLESLPSYSEWEKFEISIQEQLGDSILTISGSLRDENLAIKSKDSIVTMRITPMKDKLIYYVN